MTANKDASKNIKDEKVKEDYFDLFQDESLLELITTPTHKHSLDEESLSKLLLSESQTNIGEKCNENNEEIINKPKEEVKQKKNVEAQTDDTLIQDLFNTMMNKLSNLEQQLLSIKKRINKPAQQPPIEPKEGVLMTGNMREVKVSERKMQRASVFLNNIEERETEPRTRNSADNFDEEFEKILIRRSTMVNKKPFIPPSSIKAPETPLSHDSSLFSLVDDKNIKSSISKKFKTNDNEEENTILKQDALIELKGIIEFCIKQNCQPLTLENLRGKERKQRLTIKEAETYLFKCFCTSEQDNSTCTLCSNMKLIGSTQIYISWYDLVGDALLDIDWIKHYYRMIIWQLGKYNDAILTLSNVIYKLIKYYNQESNSQYSFLYAAFKNTNSNLVSRHCVLMVIQVIKNEQSFELELTDGRYCIKSQQFTFEKNNNESIIAKLIKEEKIQEYMKLHIVNAKLLNTNGKLNGISYFQIMKNARLEITYNGLSRALESAKLGLQSKGWLYKSVDSLSQYGGVIEMLDVILLSKSGTKGKGGKYIGHFIDALSIIQPEKDKIKVEVLLNSVEQFNIIEEGKRYKIFHLIPEKLTKAKRSGVIYLKTIENSKIIECNKTELK